MTSWRPSNETPAIFVWKRGASPMVAYGSRRYSRSCAKTRSTNSSAPMRRPQRTAVRRAASASSARSAASKASLRGRRRRRAPYSFGGSSCRLLELVEESNSSRLSAISSWPCSSAASCSPAFCASSGSIAFFFAGVRLLDRDARRRRRASCDSACGAAGATLRAALAFCAALAARGDDVFARHAAAALQRGRLRARPRRHRAILREPGAAAPRRRLELALAEDEHERRRVEDRVVAARADADEQREREVLERRAAEREQRDQRDDDRRERVERARHRLLDRLVDDRVVRLRPP